MVTTVPNEFPSIPNVNFNSSAKNKISTIKRKLKIIEELWDDGEFIVDEIDELNEKLLEIFSNWIHDPVLIDTSRKIFDPEFVAQAFVEFALNYEGELEEGLEHINSFLTSYFIIKTWADDKTYVWAPHSLHFFLHFLYQVKIINESSLNDGMDLIADTYDTFYSKYRRYINPSDDGVLVLYFLKS